jgi:hypothetical protein
LAVKKNITVTNWRPYDLNPTPSQILQDILQKKYCNITFLNVSKNGGNARATVNSVNTETGQPRDSLIKTLQDNKANYLISNF